MSQATPAAGADLPSDPDAAAIVRASVLQDAIEAAAALVDECRLDLRADGFHVRAVDPAKVASVELDLPAQAFESYDAAGEQVGVDLVRLADVVGLAGSDQLVRLALDAETRRLHVAVDELSYTLGLIDPEVIRSPPPREDVTFDHSATVTVPAAELDRAVDAASMVSSHLLLGVDADENEFYVEATGDTDDVSLRLGEDDLSGLDAGAAESLFSLDYLAALARPVPAGTDARLQLGTELPMTIGFDVGDAGSVEYLLSPRLTSS